MRTVCVRISKDYRKEVKNFLRINVLDTNLSSAGTDNPYGEKFFADEEKYNEKGDFPLYGELVSKRVQQAVRDKVTRLWSEGRKLQQRSEVSFEYRLKVRIDEP